MSRTYATLSPPMIEALDRVAATDGKSRTQVVNEAVQRWLEGRGEWPPGGPHLRRDEDGTLTLTVTTGAGRKMVSRDDGNTWVEVKG